MLNNEEYSEYNHLKIFYKKILQTKYGKKPNANIFKYTNYDGKKIQVQFI